MQINEVQTKVDAKKRDIEGFQEKEKTLFTEFQTMLGENNKWVDYLTKVFKKRIKRSKKKKDEEEGLLNFPFLCSISSS